MAKYHMQSFESIAQKLFVGASEGQIWHASTSVDLVWWPDLTLTWKFHRRRRIYQREATENFPPLRATVFPLFTKNSRGGGLIPPATARVNHWAETNFDKDLLKRKFHGLSPISLTQTPSLNSFWDYSFLDTKGCILLKFDSYDLWWLKYWPKRKNHLTTFGYDFDELSFAFSTLVSDAWESS